MDEAWSCDRCTLINSLSSTTCVACGWQCAVPAPAPTPTAAECERAVEQIWNLGSLKALLTLVTNILDHPGEAKYLGPIKKSNSRINGSIVQVSGAAQVLHLAGFREDAEAFASAGDVVRLRRVQHALRKQQEVVQNSHGYKEGAVLSSKPRFDENLLREIHAEAQHQATLRGAPAAPATAPGHDGSAAPTAATSPAALRLRLRIPVGGSVEMKIPSETKVQAFQEEVLRLTGVKAHHQRLRFGFPSSKILKDDARSASLKEVGLQDGELLILEDLHDLFLGNLESGQFTMEEMLDKVPPSPEDGEDCTVTLFLDVLSAFEIESHSLDFWHAIRQRLREYFAEDQVGEMTKVSAGLKKLQQLFRHHDTRQRMQLILGSLPIRWKLHQSNKLVIQRSSFFESVARQVHSMNRRTMLTRLHISYQGEKGVDAGGLTRDFFASFARHMAEEAWLWRSTGRGSLHPTYGGKGGAGQMYQVCGRVFAMALLHGCKLGRPLSRPFMRLLLHVRPSSLQELQAELNYEAGEQVDFRCRKDFLETPLADLGLDGMLNFSHEGQEFIPGGAQIEVTDENKEQWLWHSLQQELFSPEAERAADDFRQGLIHVLGGRGPSLCPLLFLFAPEDLIDLWGSGALGKRELALWKSVCSVNSRIQQQAAWFWQVLEEEFDDELRSKVLQFATGTSSIGRDGLSAFRLEPGDGGDGRLPTAMTCGNLLQLPRYSSRQVLRQQLQTAVESTGSFEML